ncbi:MAG: SUMF1/EgtB/PvdO family nonheme iron enzyme [Ekhidna sp.]
MIKTTQKITVSMLILCFAVVSAFSNNVKVENVRLRNQNTTADTKEVEFDLSWENSWRTSAAPSNYDACWIFAKYRLTSASAWNHVTLSTTGGDHTAPSGSSIEAVGDGKGIFIYRSADGSGNNDWDDIRLQWTYGVDGLADSDSVEIAVFAIEMVYIPEGSFDLGDGNGVSESTQGFELAATDNLSITITNALSALIETDASLTYDDAQLGSTGIYLDGDGGIDLNGDGDFADANENGSFPVGYNAMYCMKYEVSQGQYVDFVNKLDASQTSVLIAAEAIARQNIAGSGNSWASSTPNRPKDLGIYDLWAYLDWAALRPMTETEFEKICRGSNAALTGEYPWGTTNLYTSAYTLSLDGTEEEVITNPGSATGNASYATTDGSLDGPLRCGIFAASSGNHTREETGGTFYGVMEMGGNLSEVVVFLGDPDGRSFDGSNGDGAIAATGYANQAGWPAYDGLDNNLNDGGATVRGGYYGQTNTYMRVSDRFNVAAHPGAGSNAYGGRGVRNQ